MSELSNFAKYSLRYCVLQTVTLWTIVLSGVPSNYCLANDNELSHVPVYKLLSAEEPIEVDLGSIQTGQVKSFEFALANWTGTTLTPGSATATCGCTDIEFTYFNPQAQPEIFAGGGLVFFRASIRANTIEEKKGVIVRLLGIDEVPQAEVVLKFESQHLLRAEPGALQMDLGDGVGYSRENTISFSPNFDGAEIERLQLDPVCPGWGISEIDQVHRDGKIDLTFSLINPQQDQSRSLRRSVSVNVMKAGTYIETIEIPILLSGFYHFFPESVRLEEQDQCLKGRCSVVADRIEELLSGEVTFELRSGDTSIKHELDVRVERRGKNLASVYFEIVLTGSTDAKLRKEDVSIEVFHHGNLVQVLKFF